MSAGRPRRKWQSVTEVADMTERTARRLRDRIDRQKKGEKFASLRNAVQKRIDHFNDLFVQNYAPKAAQRIVDDEAGRRKPATGKPVRPVAPNPKRKFEEPDKAELAKPQPPQKSKRRPTPMAAAVANALVAARAAAPPPAPPPAGVAPAAAAIGGAAAAAHSYFQPRFMPEADFDVKFPKMPGQAWFDRGTEMTMYKVTSTDGKIYARMEGRQAIPAALVDTMGSPYELYAECGAAHSKGFLVIENWTCERRGGWVTLKYATAFCKDGNLSAYVKKTYHDQGKQVPPEFVALVEEQLLESVGVMESRNIRHQDLKSLNVLWFDDEQRARIIDPGMMVRVEAPRSDDVPDYDHPGNKQSGEPKPEDKAGVQGTFGFMSSEAFYRIDRIGNDRDAVAFIAIEMVTGRRPFHKEIVTAKFRHNGDEASKEEKANEVQESLNRAGVLPFAFGVFKKEPYSDFAWLILQLTKFHLDERLTIKDLLRYPLFTNTPDVALSTIDFEPFVARKEPMAFVETRVSDFFNENLSFPDSVKILKKPQVTFTLKLPGADARPFEIGAESELTDRLTATFPDVKISQDVRTICAKRVDDVFHLAKRLRTLDALKTQRNVSERSREIVKQRHVVLNSLLKDGVIRADDYNRFREEDYGKDVLEKADKADAARQSAGVEKEAGAAAFTDADGYDDEIAFIHMAWFASLSERNKFWGVTEEEEESSESESSGDESEPEPAEGEVFEPEPAESEGFEPEPGEGEGFAPEPDDGDEFGPGAAAGSSAGGRRGGDAAAGAAKRQRTGKSPRPQR